ncbi:MAG: transcriptional repressor NrdR [Planctomycetales bacterium]|nr:transcriptional repressor NrdR [Planctomycetales bacterium]
MFCPHCASDNDRVLDSRTCDDGRAIRRRRFCNSCQKRFTTYERVEFFQMQVVKKDHVREPFQREKIEQGVKRACWKRPVSTDQIRELADRVEADVQRKYDLEISSSQIGRIVMHHLATLDQVAYVRFASVYREFKDVEDFVAELAPLMNTPDTAESTAAPEGLKQCNPEHLSD